MAYKYNEYHKEYNRQNVINVSLRLSKKTDQDIIQALGENKNANMKRLIRLGLKKEV